MKIIIEDKTTIIYLTNTYLKNIELKEKEFTEKYIKKICHIIQNNCDLQFDGYYNVKLFVDTNYGIIINISKEEYLDYFTNQIQLNTEIIKDKFLYEVQSLDNISKENNIIYKNKDKLYFQTKENINIKSIEHIKKILYGKERKEILKQAQIVR